MAGRTATACLMPLVMCVALMASCTNGEVSSARYGTVEFAPGEGPLQRSRTVRIDQVTTGADAGAVTVSFIGGPAGDVLANPCHTDYELEVDATTVPVTLTVWQVVPSVPPEPIGGDDVDFGCTSAGHARVLHLQWRDGLPTKVNDGSNGATLEVINVAGLLQPDELPSGWSMVESEAPDPPDSEAFRFTDGTHTAFMYVTLHARPMDELETIRTGPNFAEVLIRDGTVAEVSTSEGRPQLRFVDGSYLYQLSADQEVAPEVLIDIAERLNE